MKKKTKRNSIWLSLWSFPIWFLLNSNLILFSILRQGFGLCVFIISLSFLKHLFNYEEHYYVKNVKFPLFAPSIYFLF